jgi:hypothetical protein
VCGVHERWGALRKGAFLCLDVVLSLFRPLVKREGFLHYLDHIHAVLGSEYLEVPTKAVRHLKIQRVRKTPGRRWRLRTS